MKEITNCYANWRIDVIILLGCAALLLACCEGGTILPQVCGITLAVTDVLIARRWWRCGKLQQLDNITE